MKTSYAHWVEQYSQKVVPAEEAVKTIESNYRVFLTGNCSIPQKTLTALIARAPEIENVEICQALTIGKAPD
jgi:4-hydroxybutyrate CoA-transferase